MIQEQSYEDVRAARKRSDIDPKGQYVRMNADYKKFSAGHTYAVSKALFKQLTSSRASIRVKHGAGTRMEGGFLAVKATRQDRRDSPEATDRPLPPLVYIQMDRGTSRLNTGRVYGVSEKIATMHCEGYGPVGGKIQPIAHRVEAPERKAPAFRPDRTPGISPRIVKAMGDAGIKGAKEIASASIADLTKFKGVGKSTAERLKLAARAHME